MLLFEEEEVSDETKHKFSEQPTSEDYLCNRKCKILYKRKTQEVLSQTPQIAFVEERSNIKYHITYNMTIFLKENDYQIVCIFNPGISLKDI